ncbi:MAG: hypothetical protein NTV49_07490 [Kiritimatiellaeota bacterium]|nr:hypothetical protein [Kiritimatiellota bacterium]
MKYALICWGSKSPAAVARTEEIEHFDARGMRRVYGRGDHFGHRCTFNMEIWKTHDGRLLMRCWSWREDYDWRSFEIKGLDTTVIPEKNKKTGFQESWVPKSTRNAYEQWIREEF